MASLPRALAFSCLSLVASLSSDLAKERPVMKVVRLLQDMKAQLESELEDDQAVHEKLGCWCKSNDEEKTAAIASGEAKESQLETFLGEAAARMAQMKIKRDATLQEVDSDVAALEQARTLRMKENKEFHAEDMNLLEAIKACDQAITVLKEYNPNSAGFAQVRAVAQRLQQANVLSLGRASVVTSAQMATLRAFLDQSQASGSFLSIPGYQSYAPQSGQIYGVLEQLKEDFEKDLSDTTAKEKKNAAEFASLKAAKEEEIVAGRALVAELDGEIANLKAQHAEAFQELEDTQAQLELDRTFLATLKRRCSESSAEYDARVKDRSAEIAAVADTIVILNDDAAFDNFEETVNTAFVQVSSLTAETEQQREKLGRVAVSLERSAAILNAPGLALVASAAKLDAFTKVKEMIQKMVVELNKQNADEIDHRDWCINEFASNNRSTEKAYDKRDSLVAKDAELTKYIAYADQELKESAAAVAASQEQMKRASENREAANAEYQKTVADQRTTQMILKKALARMKEVYALMQEPGAPHIHLSGNSTDPGNGPARFTNYEKNTNGGRVVGMLQEVIADSHKMEDDAIAAEQDSQTAYEELMKESNAGIAAKNKYMVNLKGSKAKSQEDLTMTKSDIKSTMGKLEDLSETLGDLNMSCDFIMKNFDLRQEARTAEINALNEATAILSGMK